MRNTCLIFLFAFCFGLITWAEEDCSADSCARFEILGEYLCDTGNVSDDISSLCASFWLKSAGNKPLIIVSSSTSCPCTQAFYDKDIIPPGDSVEIKLVYDIQSHHGAFLQSVLLKMNTVPDDYVWFHLKGCVVEGSRKD